MRYAPAPHPTPPLPLPPQHCTNFAKHEVLTKLDIFQKFGKITKNKIFAATLLQHNLLSAAQTPIC